MRLLTFRELLGFLIVPAAPALGFMLAGLFSRHPGEFYWSAKLFLVIAYAAAFLVGLPLFIVVKRWGKASRVASTACGAIVGIVPPAIFFTDGFHHSGTYNSIELRNLFAYGLLGAVIGALLGLMFWRASLKPEA